MDRWGHVIPPFDDIVSSDEHMSEATRARVLEWFSVASHNQKLSQAMKPEDVVLPEWFKGLIAVTKARSDGEIFARDYEARFRKLVSENHPHPLHALVTEAGKQGRHHLVSFLDLMDIKAFCPKFEDENAVPWIVDRLASLQRHLIRWAQLGETQEKLASKQACIETLETRAGVRNLSAMLEKANVELGALRIEVNKLRDGVVAAEAMVKQAQKLEQDARIERDNAREDQENSARALNLKIADETKLGDEIAKLREENQKLRDEVLAAVIAKPAKPAKPRPPRKHKVASDD